MAKGRPFNDPLIVHIAGEHELELLTTAIPEHAKRLAQVFWPGPLTLILPRGPRVPSLVTAGLETVAIRMPRHPVALALIRALGSPVAAPSANRFMHVSPTTAQHALADLAGRVPLILDGGPCQIGVESTVLDLCSEVPTILRPGGISLEALRSVLPHVQLPIQHKVPGRGEDVQAKKAPGQLLTHYAPNAADPAEVAAALFAGLRALEEARVQVILCRNFGDRGLGLAIRDRLLKAAGGKIFGQD